MPAANGAPPKAACRSTPGFPHRHPPGKGLAAGGPPGGLAPGWRRDPSWTAFLVLHPDCRRALFETGLRHWPGRRLPRPKRAALRAFARLSPATLTGATASPGYADAGGIALRARRASAHRFREPAERWPAAQSKLAELELRAGLEPESDSAPEAAALDASDALFSFHLDEPHSYSWVITREGFEAPAGRRGRDPRPRQAFPEALRRDSTDSRPLGERLYENLFGQTGPRAQAKPRWRLAVEDVLFGTPFPALHRRQVSTAPTVPYSWWSATQSRSSRALASCAPEPRCRGGSSASAILSTTVPMTGGAGREIETRRYSSRGWREAPSRSRRRLRRGGRTGASAS